MILIQRFQEAVALSPALSAGTQTHTRAHAEAPDQDAQAALGTKTATGARTESPDPDCSAFGTAFIPRSRDPDSDEQG